MTPQQIITQFPFPIASVYADLENAEASPQTAREAIYFTCYQLMRTVGLTLVGQYLAQEPPADASDKARKSLNRIIAGLRSPYFSDWMTLLGTLHKRGAALGLDFMPEFGAAMNVVHNSRVEVPAEYGLNHGARREGLNWLDAFLALRNGSAHSGMARDEACREAVRVFRPHLDELLDAFSVLSEYELLVLRSDVDDEPALVQTLRGAQPGPAQAMEVEGVLYDAFEFSPVVMRSPHGPVQGLFPLFHGHIEGEPLRCYDGHYLLDSDTVRRRTIYYLGTEQRLTLEDGAGELLAGPPSPATDAAERLRALLEARAISWHLRREEIAPWTLRDNVNDYARRTLDDLTGVKYLPSCYLDRPALSEPLQSVATAEAPPQRAFLLTGRAGSGKTALLCDLVQRLLQGEESEHLVFFVRGDGLTPELEGGNLLLSNLLHKIGLNPREFARFDELFGHLAARLREDKMVGRRFVIVLDALNEARFPSRLLHEALEMAAAARAHPWLRLVFSAREEFLAVWRGRHGETESNPFHAAQGLFVPPPADPSRPLRPEDPPAWEVPTFSETEAETVYRRYQLAQREGAAVPACRTDWQRIAPATRANLLTMPLHLDLWMRAFDGREAPAVSSEIELFESYLNDLRGRFVRFWESMAGVLDYMLQHGRMELGDADAHEIEATWRAGRPTEEMRLHFTPLETAVAAGVVQKRTTEEGGGYRIPHQRLREALIYLRLLDRDPQLRPESLRAWLELSPTEELEGALAQVAEELWERDRSAELVVFLEEIASQPGSKMGVHALGRMLARRLELREEAQPFAMRLSGLLDVITDEVLARRMNVLLIYRVPEQIERFPGIQTLIIFRETTLSWVKEKQKCFFGNTDGQGDVASAYVGLGDAYQFAGRTDQALQCYERALEIRERLYKVEPYKIGLAHNVSLSTYRIGDLYLILGQSEKAMEYYQLTLEILKPIHDAEPTQLALARQTSVAYNKLGDIYWLFGDIQHAMEYFQEAWTICERIYQAEPKQPIYARDASFSYERIGDVFWARRESERALQSYQNSLDIRESLFQMSPHRSDFAHEMCIPIEKIGDFYMLHEEYETALEYFLRVLKIREQLHQTERERTDYARAVCIPYERLGDVYRAMGEEEVALKYYRCSLEIRIALHQADPKRTDYAIELCIPYERLGDVYWEMEEEKTALDFYHYSLEIREKLHYEEPDRADFARDVSFSYEKLAKIYDELGEMDIAQEYSERYLEIEELLCKLYK